MSIRKKTSNSLLMYLDKVVEASLMIKKVGNSYILNKLMKVCNDGLEHLIKSENYITDSDYIALIARFKEAIEKKDAEGVKVISSKLKKIILENTIYKVVFMPYKASMWDSLESIWFAADKDKRCETLVVPITYYELNNNGSPSATINERDLFPCYVPVINDEEYDFENDLPDIIYIHNPYVDCNRVTRVKSRYYSYNLKKYCEKLVYVPYCKYIDGVSSTNYIPGIYNADYAVQNSEEAVERYINTAESYSKILEIGVDETREILKNKFINLGSAEVDKVVSLNADNTMMPSEWKDKVLQSRVNVLYNTTLAEVLGARNLKKIKETLDLFKDNSSDAFVIWRPHPLMRQTIVSMIPDLLDEYDSIVEEFRNNEYGVLDSNASMYYAMFWSDMCYGCNSSSLTELYKYTGKIVLQDSPGTCGIISNISEEQLLDKLNANNVVSEPECSLEDVVDVISNNEELKKGTQMHLENSGKKINDYMIKSIELI